MEFKRYAEDSFVVTILAVVGVVAIVSAIVISYPALAFLASKLH